MFDKAEETFVPAAFIGTWKISRQKDPKTIYFDPSVSMKKFGSMAL
jgi:hypothetical protein